MLLHIGIIKLLMHFKLIPQVSTLVRKTIKLSKLDKFHLKLDVIDGSVVNGLRQPILYNFVLDEPPGYKVFSEPETMRK